MPKGQHPIVGRKQNKYLLNLHSIKKERMNQSWYLKNLKQCQDIITKQIINSTDTTAQLPLILVRQTLSKHSGTVELFRHDSLSRVYPRAVLGFSRCTTTWMVQRHISSCTISQKSMTPGTKPLPTTSHYLETIGITVAWT